MIVYVAGPYSQANTGDLVENVRKAIQAGEVVKRHGHLPFVPHLFHLWDLMSPHEREYWMSMDLEWVEKCQVLLRLPGESPGADLEIQHAKDYGLVVLFGIEEFIEWSDTQISPPSSPSEADV